MSDPKTWFAVLCLATALSAGPAMAESGHTKHSAHKTHAAYRRTCCRAPAGTQVEVELAEPVSSRTQKAGDSFALRLAAPLVVDGEILLRQGTPGVGEVITSAGPGFGGKAAKLVLVARYLSANGRRVPLEGLQLAKAGRNNGAAASAVGLTGLVFAPLGLIGFAVRGGNVDLPEGLSASARLATNVVLPPLGHAKASEAAPQAASADQAVTEQAAIEIPPPPHGKGEVVFFRRRSLLSLGQWFKVRENGKAICKLTNAAYCIVVTDPGPHTYTAKFEPELKDHLTLQIDPGDTFYVEGATSKALLIGAADLMPSDRETFAEESRRLKPAPPVAPNGADDGPDDKEAGAKGDERKP
jgi:hypothetical protein